MKKKLSDGGIGDEMIEGLGFQAKAELEYGFKERLELVHFDLYLFEALFMSVDMCIIRLKMGSNQNVLLN